MSKTIIRQFSNVLAVLATIVINGLANALPLNNLTTGEISDRFKVYFVPAGYVFSIWGIIYLGLIAFAIYQALPSQRENPRLAAIGYLPVLSAAANIAWLFLWHYLQFPLTLLAMFTLLVSLVLIYLRLGIGRTACSAGERWCVRVPFSIYLGWVTVATIANVTSVLEVAEWDGWGLHPATWAAIMLAVGMAVAAAVGLTRRDVAYLLVIIWAFIGIAVKHAAVTLVATTAWVATIVVVIICLLAIFRPARMKRA